MFGRPLDPSSRYSLPSLLQAMMGDPRALFEQMMRDDPSFRKFVNDNAGKNPEQIARENGIDPAEVQRLIRR